jgi:hypothetical protein
MTDSRRPRLRWFLLPAIRALHILGAVAALDQAEIIAADTTPPPAPKVWRQASFRDFAGGTFSDAGANAYVSAAGRIQTVNRWDFNGDGHIDILCANSHPLLEMLDLSIYWGNSRDFSIQRHTYVPADGPMWVAAGDLDGDGAIDLVSANYSNGTWTSMDSAIYWGATKTAGARAGADTWTAGPFRGRTFLPSQNAQGVAIADLNRDGFPEIIFAFSAGFWEYRGNAKPAPSRIYWNQRGAFSRERFTDLPVVGATDVDVADVNGDGWPDLAFSVGEGPASSVYFGGPAGFSAERSVSLPTRQAHAVRFGDVDGDQRIDVVFANEEGDVSWAYLNRDGTFAPGARLEFATHFAKDVVIADFNRDGRPDVFFANHMSAPGGEARFGNRFQPSYLYYGSAAGFSVERRVSIQTIGAWGANAADLNGDGWPDLLVCNFQEHYSFEVPSFVYWGGPDGFDVTRRTPLYEHGAQGNLIADLNGDGHLDLVITSMMGRSRGDYDPSYLYLGNAQGAYNTRDRIILPGREPYEQAMADLDDNGTVDVLLMNQGEVTRYENEVWVFWNKDNKLDPWRVTGLPAYAGVGVEVADLDRDGYLDVIVANNKQYPSPRGTGGPGHASPGPARPGSFIYWGGPQGYAISDRTALNVFQARSPSIADLNGDGHLDLVFAGQGASIFWGDGTRGYGDTRRQRIPGTLGQPNHQTEVADLNRDGYLDIVFAGTKVMIYWGDAGRRYDESKRTVLNFDAKTMTIADVNADGWLDLVCPLYKEKGSRSLDSAILLGGPDGFSERRVIRLPTDGGTGSIVSDFNYDGYPDVFFFCHRRDGSPEVVGSFGDHDTVSRLYWGGPQGFARDRYLPIPSIGVHYDVGIDLGTISDRSFAWEYVSAPHEAGAARWRRLHWDAVTPGRTAVRFQVRSAAAREALAGAPWRGPTGPGSSFVASGADLSALPAGPWIQYKLILDTHNGAASPVVSAVQIDFQ